MELVEYGKVVLTVVVQNYFECISEVLVDGKIADDCLSGNNKTKYIFYVDCGNHFLTIKYNYIKNDIGKLRFDFFTASPKSNYFNHLFAFHYDIFTCYTEISMNVHRNAQININVDKNEYINFLNVKGSFLLPKIVNYKNIKVNSEKNYVLGEERKRKRFFILQTILYTMFFLTILIIYGFFIIEEIKNWDVDIGFRGESGKISFFIGSCPVIILTLLSYFYYIIQLIKIYKNGEPF